MGFNFSDINTLVNSILAIITIVLYLVNNKNHKK